jgi:hypothetical protein
MATPAFPQIPGLEQRQVQFGQVIYPFYLFVSASFDAMHPLPAILLLIHGGGGNGPDLIEAWKNFAEQTGIILVGISKLQSPPTLPYDHECGTRGMVD